MGRNHFNEHIYVTPGNVISVSMVCINVCGLLTILIFQDFEEFCQS